MDDDTDGSLVAYVDFAVVSGAALLVVYMVAAWLFGWA
jgi:hypothetical protein